MTVCIIAWTIDPLAIQTIKTQPYSKTFIATQEFAKRIKALHKLESGNELLALYLENLNKDLSEVDSLVSGKLNNNNNVFVEFAREKLTKYTRCANLPGAAEYVLQY